MAATTIGEIKILVETLTEQFAKMDSKFDALSTSVTEHHAKDLDKCAKIDQLYMDIHGDGNGKKGLRREVDAILAFMEGRRKMDWIVIGAAVSAVGAFAANLIKDLV